jgi:hypothetical protein
VAGIGRALIHAARQAEDLLLFYYAGHGLLGWESRELYLSVADTEPNEMLPFTALPFTAVRQAFRSGRASNRVVILDSCFSGRAIAQSLTDDEVLGQIEVSGSYVLTAAPANRTALVLPGEPHTAFTHRLLDVLTGGISGAGELLSLDAVFREVQARSRAAALPVPEKSGTATADMLGLVRNRRRGLAEQAATPQAAELAAARVFIAERSAAIEMPQCDREPPVPTVAHRDGQVSVDVTQNEFLTPGTREVHAMVTVTRTSPDRPGLRVAAGHSMSPSPSPCQGEQRVIFIIDASSMMAPYITNLRQAVNAAIEALPDGIQFAVIAGRHYSQVIYPHGGSQSLVPASPRTRAEAAAAVDLVHGFGARDFGLWLVRAARLFLVPDPLDHVILLAAGTNGDEYQDILKDAVAACTGLFTADCRGIGEQWQVGELRMIADTLLGTVNIVRDIDGLHENLHALTVDATGRDLGDVRLRLRVPRGATVRYVKQASPHFTDLTRARRATVDPLVGDYLTGSWGSESREYHICIELEPGRIGQEKFAGRVQMVAKDRCGTTLLGEGNIRAVWTGNEDLSTRINSRVAHYTGQAELAEAIQEGLDAQQTKPAG